MYTSNKNLPYVYKLTHKITKQFYFGFRSANKLPSDQDILKYQSSSSLVRNLGFENFDCEIIAEFFKKEDAYFFENQLIKENFNNALCLNRHYYAGSETSFILRESPNKGKKLDQEWCKKLSESRLGEKNGMYGRQHTAEAKAKMSANSKGTNVGAKNGMFGKTHSAEARAKVAAAQRGKWSENRKRRAAETMQRNKLKKLLDSISIYHDIDSGFVNDGSGAP